MVGYVDSSVAVSNIVALASWYVKNMWADFVLGVYNLFLRVIVGYEKGFD